MVVNLKTGKALGLALPPSILAARRRVIEYDLVASWLVQSHGSVGRRSGSRGLTSLYT
jgi:hypothetical protein